MGVAWGASMFMCIVLLVLVSLCSAVSSVSQNTDTSLTTSNTQALSCYKAYSKWRSNSMNWFSTAIMAKTWSTTTCTSTITQMLTHVSTIYPSASLSTYKLCDGSPRVDLVPTTVTSEYTSLSEIINVHCTAGLPTYPVTQPCKASPEDCEYLYYSSGLPINDITLQALCGSPAHLGLVSVCIRSACCSLLIIAALSYHGRTSRARVFSSHNRRQRQMPRPWIYHNKHGRSHHRRSSRVHTHFRIGLSVFQNTLRLSRRIRSKSRSPIHRLHYPTFLQRHLDSMRRKLLSPRTRHPAQLRRP
jgi:hypothetical protein